jgi:hypothetical protein
VDEVKRTELKRGQPLRADPAKLREWQDRSRKRLPAKSDRREDETPDRQSLVALMLRVHPSCQAGIPFCCTVVSTEVNEIVRRSQWAAGYLVKGNCEALCHNCHAYITVHAPWAKAHGHQIEGKVHDHGGVVYALAAATAEKIRADTFGVCDVDCKLDHREEY